MLARVAAFELRYQLKSPAFIATAALFFLLRFVGMSLESLSFGGGGKMFLNSPDALATAQLLTSLVFPFVAAALVSAAILRDDQTDFGPILRSTRIAKADYLFGRFLAAFLLGALVMAMVPLGSWLGTLMPTAAPETIGPNRVVAYFYSYGLFGLTNALIVSAILFAFAAVTRSAPGTYLGVIALIAVYIASQAFFASRPQLDTLRSLADPFGLGAFQSATRYLTASQINDGFVPLTGLLLWSRLLWIGVSIGIIAFTYALYRFADRGVSPRKLRKLGRQARDNAQPAQSGVSFRAAALPRPHHDARAARAQFSARAAMEARHIFKSPAFLILLLIVMAQTFLGLWFNEDQFGQQAYPIAAALIPLIHENFRLILIVIAVFYGGDLVWRERERRIHEIIDATPLPTWALMLPKMLGLALVLLAVLLVGLAVGLFVQLARGGVDLELDKYLSWYLIPAGVDAILVAILSVFVQALSPNKYAGWGLMALYVAALLFGSRFGLGYPLFVYGSIPSVPISDINGLGVYWKAAWWFRLFWASAAVLLLVAVHLLWPRGTEKKLKPQLRRLRHRLRGQAGLTGAAAAAILLLSGGWIIYNTAILNSSGIGVNKERSLAEYEKRFARYLALPQPTVKHVELDVALYPDAIRAETEGRYRLVNQTSLPIDQVHVRMLDSATQLIDVRLPNARLEEDHVAFGYRIYRLDAPMQPGEARTLGFRTRREQVGFRAGGADERLVPNGTDLNSFALAPVIGMTRDNLLSSPATRARHGLPAAPPLPRLEDVSATTRNSGNQSWTTADITVSTSVDQTPIAPGEKVSEQVSGGRRTARFVSDTPILHFFSVQSGRYAVKEMDHDGVKLAVHYHPQHHWNVDRMLRAMRGALDYYSQAFGPYQFDQARIIESPSYRDGGQAFANTIPFSETAIFTIDYRDPAAIDILTFGTAHELAHQWWGHQVSAAHVQGGTVLSETLAQYSALMVMKKLAGESSIRRFLRFQLDRYLSRRRDSTEKELPLLREDQPHIVYGKGALIMYLLQERISEAAVNRALRSLVDRFRFAGPPYPRSVELIQLLRAEATTPEQQALITDLFERVTLFDLRTDQFDAARRADGRWDVTMAVEARKFYANEEGKERETPLDEPIEIGLFTAEPGSADFGPSNVLMLKLQPVRSGRQLLRFITDRRPTHAGIDPYNYYIDRVSADNVSALAE